MPNLVDVTIRGDDETGPAFASVAARAAVLKRQLADVGKISVGLDMSRLGTDLIGLRSKIQALGIADLADVNVQPGRIVSQLQFLKRSIEQQKISDLLDVNINQSSLAAQLASLKGLSDTLLINPSLNKAALTASLAAIKGVSASIPVTFDVSKVPNLPVLGPTQDISEKFQIIGVQQAEAQLVALKAITDSLNTNFASLTSSTDRLNAGLDALAAAAGAAAGSGGSSNGSGGVAALSAAAAAGGRAIGGWGGILGGTIGLIQTWHVVLDLAIESLVAIGASAAAAAVGIAAMAPAAQDIYTHLQAVNAVNAALGSSIPPLTGKFQELSQAMAPQTIEAFGGALNLINGQTGVFAKTAGEVVTLFDDWIAKLDIWEKSQSNAGGLLQAGIGFLTQFGSIIAKIGLALDNLIVKDPGTAHFLLDILNAAAGLLDLVTKLPAPILETALAIHGWYVYGGAALGVLSKLPGPIGAIGNALNGISHGQLLLLAAFAAGAFELARAWDTAAPSVTKDIRSTVDALNQLPASQAIPQAVADIGHFNQAIQSLSLDSVEKQLQSWGSTFQSLGDRWTAVGHDFEDIWNQLTRTGGSLVGIFKDFGNAIDLVIGRGDQAQIAMVQMAHDTAAYQTAIDQLLGSQKNEFTVLGQLMQGTLAGGAATHNFTDAIALMDLAGVRANDSLAVMRQKIDNLVTGYQNMSVSGGMLAGAVNAVTLASEIQSSKVSQLTQAYTAWFSLISSGVSGLDSFASSLSTLDGTLKLGTTNLGGLTAAQITAQQQFTATASAAQTQFNSLTQLASAAGLGQKGTDMLTQAMKDYIAILIPASQGNDALRQQLIGLAQEVNPNITSFQQLTTWVGNVHQPMQNLDSITTTLTKDAGNLTADIQNLSTALGQTLTDAMAQAAVAATGGDQKMAALATTILATGADSNKTQQDALALAEQLVQLTGSTKNAHDEFVTFVEGALHLTQTQAETLWKQTLPGLQGFIDSMHGKNIDVNLSTSGSGEIIITGTGITTRTINTSSGQVSAVGGHTALGGYITGGIQGQDSVPILAMPGEVVVPTNMVNAGAVDHLRGRIPGFSAGGVVDPINGAVNTLGTTEAQFGSDATFAFAQAAEVAAQAAAQAAAAKAAAAATSASAATVSGSFAANQALGKSMAASRGWTGTLWNDVNSVEMAEAGWNPNAKNPSSNAYGIAQFINGPSEYYQYGGNPNTVAGQITGFYNYMQQRYSGPAGAWAHESAYHWYDNGGWLQPGPNFMWNGTGAPEHLTPAGGNSQCITLEVVSGGNSEFEQFMLMSIRNWVRIKGGGDVQKTFGRS